MAKGTGVGRAAALWSGPPLERMLDALLPLAGAVAGFGAVGAYAFGGVNGLLVAGTRDEVRVWGGIHLPSIGLSIGAVTGLTHLVHRRPAYLTNS